MRRSLRTERRGRDRRTAPGEAPVPSEEAHDHGTAGHAWSREIAIARLDRPERRLTEDPEALWDRVAPEAGSVVAEVGAGTGFYALEAARRVGPRGTVFAIDVSTDLVELLTERRRLFALPQLSPVRSTPESIPLSSAVADVVLFGNVLHDLPETTVAEAVRLLGPRGRLVNLDWRPGAGPVGPPEAIRLSAETADRRLASHRLVPVDRWDPGPWHYAAIYRRAGAPGATVRRAPGRRDAPGGIRTRVTGSKAPNP